MKQNAASKKKPQMFSLLQLGSDFFSIVLWSGLILWCGLAIVYFDPGWVDANAAAKTRLSLEQTKLGLVQKTLWFNPPQQFLEQHEKTVQNWVAQTMQINAPWVQGAEQQTQNALTFQEERPATEKSDPLNAALKQLGIKIKMYSLNGLLLGVSVARIVLIKVFELGLALPLFVGALIIGLAEGLMQRSIRRAELGRESAFVFHHIGRWGYRAIKWALIAFIVLPSWSSPELMGLPIAILLMVVTAGWIGRFKKYV